jgi:hypothetical protein
MKNRFSLLCIAAVLALTTSAAGQSPVVVPGDPPLTEETIGRFTEFFEWAFDARLTNDQQEFVRKYMVDSWTQKKTSDINDVVQVVQQQTELAKLPADQVRYVRVKIEPDLLAQMRQQPNEPMARWALAVYGASHRPIANGTPPLTRQGTDAFLEALFFMAGEVTGQQSVPDKRLKDDWAQALVANYPTMAADLKQQIAGMPLWASTMRMAWPELSAKVKTKYRALWAEQLKAMLPATAQASATQNTAAGGTKSVAEMMAEQNRRHQNTMNTNAWMMDIYRIKFNTQATWSGSSYRYW